MSSLPIDCYYTQIVPSDSFCCSSNKDVVSVSSDVIFSPESRWFDCAASPGSSCPRLDRHITPKRRSNGFPDRIYTEQILCYVQGVPKKRTFRTKTASSAALAPVREAAHHSPRRWAASLTWARAALEAASVLKVRFFWDTLYMYHSYDNHPIQSHLPMTERPKSKNMKRLRRLQVKF